MRDGAQVQPALLARGLRRVLLERGVTIHEGTEVTRLDAGPRGHRGDSTWRRPAGPCGHSWRKRACAKSR